MTPHTFIFIGRSGCGKGTQVKLLMDYMKEKYPEFPLYHMETGQRFRDFIARDGYTNTIAKEVALQGKRQPDFLAIWMWSHHFIDDLTGKEHLIIDGTPRSLNEAQILENAFEFFTRDHVHIVYINVSREWSEKRLLARGRADDVTSNIKGRLDWYEKDVIPAVEFFRTNSRYHFSDINGEQSIEAVHKEILENIFHGND